MYSSTDFIMRLIIEPLATVLFRFVSTRITQLSLCDFSISSVCEAFLQIRVIGHVILGEERRKTEQDKERKRKKGVLPDLPE